MHLLPVSFAFADFLLKQHEPSHQIFWLGWATGHIDVHRDVLVDRVDKGIIIPERAATHRAGPKTDHIPGLGHLLIDPKEARQHFLIHGTTNHQDIGLARPEEG